jgi:hypothetical protein
VDDVEKDIEETGVGLHSREKFIPTPNKSLFLLIKNELKVGAPNEEFPVPKKLT